MMLKVHLGDDNGDEHVCYGVQMMLSCVWNWKLGLVCCRMTLVVRMKVWRGQRRFSQAQERKIEVLHMMVLVLHMKTVVLHMMV